MKKISLYRVSCYFVLAFQIWCFGACFFGHVDKLDGNETTEPSLQRLFTSVFVVLKHALSPPPTFILRPDILCIFRTLKANLHSLEQVSFYIHFNLQLSAIFISPIVQLGVFVSLGDDSEPP